MKEHPILFTAPMVRAITEGRKSVTRRLPGPRTRNIRSGDRLWVKESWRLIDFSTEEVIEGPLSNVENRTMVSACKEYYAETPAIGPWRPSLYMPRWAARIVLEVSDVKEERLHSITNEDAVKEGISKLTKDNGVTWKFGIPDSDGLPGTDNCGWPWSRWKSSPRDAFADLWNQINGTGAWELNPKVCVITFTSSQQPTNTSKNEKPESNPPGCNAGRQH